jgi:Uncharacterised conserved protein
LIDKSTLYIHQEAYKTSSTETEVEVHSSTMPSLKRVFEHVDGNWPSHIYLSIRRSKKMTLFQEACIRQFEKTSFSSSSSPSPLPPLPSCSSTTSASPTTSTSSPPIPLPDASLGGAIFPEEHLHISLSKPFVLRYHQIEPFLKNLSHRLRVIETFTGIYINL